MNPGGPVLRDIHLPAAAWWPPALGWWLLLALLLMVAAAGIWLVRWQRRQRPLAAALREIDRLAAAFDRNGDTTALADGASRLMRRVARSVDPVSASASGAAWRMFVHAQVRDDAARKVLDSLLDGRFRAHPVLDAQALLAALRTWCRVALQGHARRVRTRRGVAPVADTQVASS